MAWLGAFSQERQGLWLPKDDLQYSSSWSSPPFVLLCDIHSKLLTSYDCKEVRAPFQSQARVGARGGRSSQDDDPLFFRNLTASTFEAFLVRGEGKKGKRKQIYDG